jgi:hypothetical protein
MPRNQTALADFGHSCARRNCHAEGRGFESLQPLPVKARPGGAFFVPGGSFELEVAHPSPDLGVPRIAGRLPECGGDGIVEGDEGRDPTDATVAEIGLGGLEKPETDTSTAILRVYGEPVNVPAPTVPAGDYRTDHQTVCHGDQEGGWTVPEEGFDVLSAVSGAGMGTTRG